MILHGRRARVLEDGGLPAGSTVAGYEIERLLGTGGMGVVYEATQLSLNRRVALKVIAPRLPDEAALRERFRREGPLQAVIEHPHILPVYEAGESRGRLFIAMRLVRGQTLKQLAIARTLGNAAMLSMLSDIAGALDAAHAAGLVHRDVKPQNVLVETGGHAYLADFGLSKGPGVETVTREGQLLGSVQYMSPEQVRGEPVTAASDVYSFACMLFECLTGLVPFPREDDVAVLHAHVWDPRPRPSEIRSELPAALDEVIASGMERHPEARAHGARELVRAAQATLDCAPDGSVVDQPVTIATRELDEATVPPQRAAPMRPRSPRFSMRATALAGVVAVALGAGGGAVVERARSQTAQAPTPPAKPKVDVRYPRALDATLVALNRGEASLAKDLRSAKTASAQATALARLAGAFASADRAASDLQPPNRARAANAAIVTALGQRRDAYRSLEAAARKHDRRAYAAAKRRLPASAGALTRALAQLEAIGYRLG